MVTVERVTSPEQVQLQDLNALLPQLHSDRLGSQEELERMISNKNVTFVVARDGTRVIGMATGNYVQKLGKKIGYIEDVVVDETYRGQGIGKKLLQYIIEDARSTQVRQIYLTSKAGRTAANALYEKLGFEKRDTNNYRLKF